MLDRGKPGRSAGPEAARFDVERSPRYRLAALSRMWTESTEKLYQAEFGLLLSEWRILGLIGFHGPVTAAQIAERGFLKKPHISRLVAGLTAKGMVCSEPDAEDARKAWLRLTPVGKAVFDRIARRSIERDALFTAALSPSELSTLDRLLDKLLAHAKTAAASEQDL